MINKFIKNKDLDYFLENFNKIEKGYSKYDKIKSYLSDWRISAFLYLDLKNRIWDEVKYSSLISITKVPIMVI